jgi:hypothetical protein
VRGGGLETGAGAGAGAGGRGGATLLRTGSFNHRRPRWCLVLPLRTRVCATRSRAVTLAAWRGQGPGSNVHATLPLLGCCAAAAPRAQSHAAAPRSGGAQPRPAAWGTSPRGPSRRTSAPQPPGGGAGRGGWGGRGGLVGLGGGLSGGMARSRRASPARTASSWCALQATVGAGARGRAAQLKADGGDGRRTCFSRVRLRRSPTARSGPDPAKLKERPAAAALARRCCGRCGSPRPQLLAQLLVPLLCAVGAHTAAEELLQGGGARHGGRAATAVPAAAAATEAPPGVRLTAARRRSQCMLSALRVARDRFGGVCVQKAGERRHSCVLGNGWR